MRRACMALFLCFAVAFGLAAPAAYAAPVVIPPDAAPTKTGNTYAAWSAVWWQYVLSIPRSANPLLDPAGTRWLTVITCSWPRYLLARMSSVSAVPTEAALRKTSLII